MAEPKDAAKVVGMLKKADELVFLGEETDGFLKVQGSNGEGWVKKSLVSKRP
ncbi:MAG: SH3 domain-containing protein [Gemmatimonadaceae bacterium]